MINARNCCGRDQQRLDVFFGVAVNQRRGTGEVGDFGKKLPRSPSPEWHDMAQAVALAHQDRAFQHDEHARSRLACRDQSLAALVASHLAEVADARDLRIGELRKHLVAAAARTRSGGLELPAACSLDYLRASASPVFAALGGPFAHATARDRARGRLHSSQAAPR